MDSSTAVSGFHRYNLGILFITFYIQSLNDEKKGAEVLSSLRPQIVGTSKFLESSFKSWGSCLFFYLPTLNSSLIQVSNFELIKIFN